MATRLRLTIGRRLAAGFGLVILVAVAASALAALRLHGIQQTLHEIVDVNDTRLEHAVRLQRVLAERAVALRNLALHTDASRRDAASRTIDDASVRFADLHGQLQASVDGLARDGGVDRRSVLAALRVADAVAGPAGDAVRQAVVAGEAAAVVVDRLDPAQERLRTALATLGESIQQANAQASAAALADARLSALTLGGATLASVVAGTLLARHITRSVTRPLAEAVTVCRSVARGDLTTPVRPTRPTSSRSMPRSRRRGPASTAAASRWWRRRCGRWPGAAPRPRATSLDAGTQQNAALVEQSAAAAASPRQEADRPAGAVAAFRLS